jgi:peptidoglycan-N-acetylglucosamine deacetylase
MGSLSDAELRARRERARRRLQARRRLTGLGAALVVVVAVVAAVLSSGGRSSLRRAGGAPATVAARQPGHRAAAAAKRPATIVQLGPIPPAQPGAAHVFTHGPAAGRMVALTFDDGDCPACVARIVDVLLRTGAHATFFPNGGYGTAWDPQARRIRALVERGQLIVGNHTFNHVDAPVVGAATFAADLRENERWIERTFGITGRPFFRPPYGAYDAGTLAAAGAEGYTHVIMWSGTVADSSPRTAPYILHAIRYWAKPGAIILMHGNYPTTARILPRILALLRTMRLRPVTIAELLGGSPYRPAGAASSAG